MARLQIENTLAVLGDDRRSAINDFTMKQLSTLLVMLIIGCGDNSRQESSVKDTASSDASAETMNEDVTLTVNVTQLPDRKAELAGTTNLPQSTNLMIIVNSRVEGDFQEQSELIVSADGTFGPTSFGANGGLDDGEYIANVTMPMPVFQPAVVKKIIGKAGEHLTGPLVQDGAKGFTVTKEFATGNREDD